MTIEELMQKLSQLNPKHEIETSGGDRYGYVVQTTDVIIEENEDFVYIGGLT